MATTANAIGRRIAAARSLGLADVLVVIRAAETGDADRAVENITKHRPRQSWA